MPVKTAQERTELSRVGGYRRWSSSTDDPVAVAAAAEGERASRARLAALIARRHLTEAAAVYATAEQKLRDLGLEVES